MTKDQERLRDMMSDLSEDYYCAGWLVGLELSLWKDLTAESPPMEGFWSDGLGSSENYWSTLDEIGRQSARCGGWIIWDNNEVGEKFVSFAEWGKLLGLPGPAELPARFHKWKHLSESAEYHLLENLSREQLIDIVLSFNHCHDHLKKKVEGGGVYMGCLHCGEVEKSYALSEIDCMILEGPDCQDYNVVAPFDLDCDPQGVVKRVYDFLRKDFHEG
jgi:hypothetical protein